MAKMKTKTDYHKLAELVNKKTGASYSTEYVRNVHKNHQSNLKISEAISKIAADVGLPCR